MCQNIDKILIALWKSKVAVADTDVVESFPIQSFPRKIEKSDTSKWLVEWLAFVETADIVKPRVVVEAIAAVALHTTAWLCLPFQHKNPCAILCKERGTNQSAQSASYDNHIVQHGH